MFSTLLILATFGQVAAQNIKPQIGYVYPPGGRAGTTVDVRIGGYDWTPDMQVIVHDPRVKIELTGPMGEPIMTPPPYWFGNKAGQAQPPLPREVPARITLPAGFPPGPVRWQVANANGGSNVGTFEVSNVAEAVEPERNSGPLDLPTLPSAVSGRISRITEVDTFRFITPEAGLTFCRLDDRLGQRFSAVLTIRDANGKVVADKADTTGDGVELMFMAQAGATYTATVNDAEFGGDRGYVYRLAIARGPSVLSCLPLVVQRGKTQTVEIVGWGVATGQPKLESITRPIAVPEKVVDDTFTTTIETPAGRATVKIFVGDTTDALEPAATDIAARQLALPTTLTGVFDRLDEATNLPVDRYQFTAKKGEIIRVAVETGKYGSSVDPSFVIVSAEGKELGRVDDVPGGTDAVLDFIVPADGMFDLLLTDLSGAPPSRSSVYRLSIENSETAFDFQLVVPDRVDVPISGKGDLGMRVVRRGTWSAPIELRFEGLPEGIELPEDLSIAAPKTPAKPAPKTPPKKVAAKGPPKNDLKITLTGSEKAGTTAALVYVIATATNENEDAALTKTIERRAGPVLVTTTLKTRCKVMSAVQDGGRLVNRGTTYPADVNLERLEGYEGPILLRMAATQQRQRRGMRGGELLVPAGVAAVQYPVFMPEWLETSLTARINVIGEVQIPDPKGKVRHVTGVMDGLIVMSLEGALLKISHEPQERVVRAGTVIEIPLRVSRSVKLPEAARVELVPPDDLAAFITAEPITLAPDQSTVTMKVKLANDAKLVGTQSFTFRATAQQNGRWPAISETTVPVVIERQDAVADVK